MIFRTPLCPLSTHQHWIGGGGCSSAPSSHVLRRGKGTQQKSTQRYPSKTNLYSGVSAGACLQHLRHGSVRTSHTRRRGRSRPLLKAFSRAVSHPQGGGPRAASKPLWGAPDPYIFGPAGPKNMTGFVAPDQEFVIFPEELRHTTKSAGPKNTVFWGPAAPKI